MFNVHMFDPKTLSWWNDQIENIDMDPPYQRRGELWSVRDRAYLIDSILNGYDIPKIYIADFSFGKNVLNSSGKQFAVIDGKQRLGAIFDFFKNRLVLDENFQWAVDPYLKLGGLSYQDLLLNYPKIANIFSNFNLSVMRVVTDDESKINELFVRLNKNKPLSGAEIRNAMGGVVPQLIRSLCSHPFFINNIKFSTKRRQDHNAAAKILLLEFRGSPVGTQKPGIDKLVEEGIRAEAAENEFQRAAERCTQILNRMALIFSKKDPLLASAGPLTVYYWLIRQTNSSADTYIREFLVNFNKQRKLNKQNLATQQGEIDNELSAYDNFDRSTDNQGSIEARFEILKRRLESWS